MREEFRREILNVLGGYQYPATVSTVKRLLDQRRMQPCGRDTVRKYLSELTEDQLVIRQALPTTSGRQPLVVYLGRSGRTAGSGEFLETFSMD
jgi:hypothetical protein